MEVAEGAASRKTPPKLLRFSATPGPHFAETIPLLPTTSTSLGPEPRRSGAHFALSRRISPITQGCSGFNGLPAYGLSPVVDASPRTCHPTYTWPAALPGSPTACASQAGCRAELHEGGAEPFKAARGDEGSTTPRDTTAHNATMPTPSP